MIAKLTTTTLPLFAQNYDYRKSIFIDTDVGFDDLLAMSSLKNNVNNKTNISLITTSPCGIYPFPEKSSKYLKKLFPSIKVLAGSPRHKNEEKEEEDQATIPSWLKKARNDLDSIMDPVLLGGSDDDDDDDDSEDSPQKCTDDIHHNIQNILKEHPNQSIDLICIGPLTNIASWIQNKDTLSLLDLKLNSIWIMGGNTPLSSSSTLQKPQPEFNFAQDPISASKVINCKYLQNRITLVTAQSCSKHTPTKEQWDDNSIMKDRRSGILSTVFQITSSWNDLKYDLICVFAYYSATICGSSSIDDNSSSSVPSPVTFNFENIEIDDQTGLLSTVTEASSSNNDSVRVRILKDYSINRLLQFVYNACENDSKLDKK